MEIQKTLKSQSNLKNNGARGLNLTSDSSTQLQSSRRYERKKRVSCSVMPNSLQSHGLQRTRLLYPWDFPGKDIGVFCHFLLQGIFPTQGSNLGLLHCRETLYRLSCMVLAQKQKSRSMEQDGKPRDKHKHLYSPNLWQRKQDYTMEKRQSLQ